MTEQNVLVALKSKVVRWSTWLKFSHMNVSKLVSAISIKFLLNMKVLTKTNKSKYTFKKWINYESLVVVFIFSKLRQTRVSFYGCFTHFLYVITFWNSETKKICSSSIGACAGKKDLWVGFFWENNSFCISVNNTFN